MSNMSHDDRLIALETAVAHLQHDFERLHSVSLELQLEIRQLSRRCERLEQRLESLESPAEFRSPAEERPPHY